MKVIFIVALSTLPLASANFSWGPCKSFEELGLYDQPININDYATSYKYIEIYKTSDTYFQWGTSCVSSSFEQIGDIVTEKLTGWYWYLITYGTNQIKTRWEAETGRGWTSERISDNNFYTSGFNTKTWGSSDVANGITYTCSESFFGLGH